MNKKPTVLAVSGSDDFYVRRFVQRFLTEQRKQNIEILYVTADPKSSELEEALTVNPLEGTTNRFVVVDRAEKLFKGDVVLLKDLNGSTWGGVTVLLCCSGDGGKGGVWDFVKGLDQKRHRVFSQPKPWEMENKAVIFCIAEAKEYGKILESRQAQALVTLSGTDLGVLAFEIQKICMLADIDGVSNITDSHLIQGRAPLMETSVGQVVQALASREAKRLALVLRRVLETRKDPPIMEVVGWLLPAVVLWLAGKDMQEKRISLEDAAATVGIHPFRYKLEVAGKIGSWTKSELIRVLQSLAEAQQQVVTGGLDPWSVLSARLLGFCTR